MINSAGDITEEELVALEHYPGDGRKMYADVALYRLTTPEENPDADNQRRPGTLRGKAADFIRASGGVVPGRVLHHHMLTHGAPAKWDYGYVHMVSDRNLVKRGASRDWIRRVDGEATAVASESLGRPSPVARPTPVFDVVRAPGNDNLVLRRLTISSELIEARENPRLLAYREAERLGARFVALQNDAHVWLWDRCAGRTYTEQFVGRFACTEFEEVFARLTEAGDRPVTPAAGVAGTPIEWSLGRYREELSDLVRGIHLLRSDDNHVERAHERLVDHFLMQLGFDPYSEISFRNGRIDMTLELAEGARLALEVKRSWHLRESGVLDQAYNYALEHGIRFFAITNGDDYVFHDCWSSLSRSENEIGRFRLSDLRDADLPLLEWVRTRRFGSESGALG